MKILLFLLLPLGCFAQLSWVESFDQATPFSQTSWGGDTSQFTIDTASYLQLTATHSNSLKVLHRTSNIRRSANWELSVRLDFNPSSSNYAKVFLWADAEKSIDIENGVFINIGGNSEDQLELGIVNNGQETILIQSSPDLLDQPFVEMRFKIQVDSQQVYNLLVDTSDWKGGQFMSVGSGQFISQAEASHFVIVCHHTSTRSDKFFFDSIIANGSDFKDEDAPKLTRWEHWNSERIKLHFDEPLDSTEVLDPAFYVLLPQGLGPSEITYQSEEQSIELLFQNITSDSLENSLRIEGLTDYSGNEVDTSIGPFFWSPLGWGDLAISEVLVDPEPVYGLPESEGLELCNSLNIPQILSGYSIANGSDTIQLDSLYVDAQSCLWLTDEGYCEQIENCLEVDWPSHFLPNTEGQLALLDHRNRLIDFISYDTEAFTNAIKSEGGWTLERNIENACANPMVWRESESANGGSPGEWNSYHPLINSPSFKIVSHSFLNAKSLVVSFNQSIIDLDSLVIKWDNQSCGSVYQQNFNKQLIIPLEETLVKTESYALSISGKVRNCGGWTDIDTTLPISLPCQQSQQDWGFRRVMFDPLPTLSTEYVEVQNLSGFPAELRGLRICTGDYDCSDPIEEPMVIGPQERVVLRGELEWGQSLQTECTIKVVEVKDFPSLNNTGETLLLLDSSLHVIAQVAYSEEDYGDLIQETSGLALCREVGSDWRSSRDLNGNVGCDCPISSPNSQGGLSLSSECISPNNDGHQDQLIIKVDSKWTESLMNLRVVDQFASTVIHLSQMEVIGLEKTISWDGTNENGRRLSVGTYFLILEMENQDHDVEKCIKSFSVCR